MRLTERVHLELKKRIQAGACCIDATVGNGHDTLLLAEFVGEEGRVIGIDRQAEAIRATRRRIKDAGILGRVDLRLGDHGALLGEIENEGFVGKVKAILFNLGYLPGGNKSITTQIPSTLRALSSSANLLTEGGCLFVTAYRGHPGGAEEARSVEAWMRGLSEGLWRVCSEEPEQRGNAVPPILWIAERVVEGGGS